MRLSDVCAIGMLLLAGACGGSSNAFGLGSDASTCALGALGCRCTNGGGCDPGGHCDPTLHICVSNVGSGGAGATGGAPGLDAGAGSGGAGGTAGSSASGAGGSAAGGTSGAGGTGASGAAGSAGSAGAGGSVDGVGMLPCGSTTCLAPKACCYKYQQVAGQSAFQTTWTCINPSVTPCATCTGTGCRVTLIRCHGSIDCPAGQECCSTLNGSSTGLASVKCGLCQAGAAICDPNQTAELCPGGFKCSPAPLLPGYGACVYN